MMRAATTLLLLSGGACILPDRDIRIESEDDNESAVRIVQRAPFVAEMDQRCNAEDEDDIDLAFCPQVRRTLASGLVTPSEGDFCLCPEGDRRAIPSFEIYAEDADRRGDSFADTVFGVALIDPSLTDANPSDAVGYLRYWEPGRAGERVGEADDTETDRTAPPQGRPAVGLWVFPLDDSTGEREIDLCNEAGRPLSVGLHTLRFMVTDRPFFRPRALDLEGEPAFEDNGDPAFGNTQWGVPDLAAGATYATIEYVFECRDPSDPEADCLCEGDDAG